ncbi:MAG: lysozyme [Amphiplicatus sp.]
MRISENGIGLIKLFEGLVLEAYQDIAGIWTIGYGHTGPDVQPGMKISEREAEELLKRDLKPRESAVGDLVRVPLNQNEFDALVSFIYNVGANAFKGSTARRRLNGGDRVGAAQALTWWNKATVNGVLREVTGLTRRRAAESALFLQPVNPIVEGNGDVAENSRLAPVEDAPRRPNLAESRSIQGATVAGGAGVAASSLGRDSAGELNSLETDIEQGKSVTVAPATPPPASADNAPPSPAGPPAEAGGAAPGAGDATTGQTVAVGEQHPARHEQHNAEAQIQLALLILIVLAVFYIIFARIDDWWRYRR